RNKRSGSSERQRKRQQENGRAASAAEGRLRPSNKVALRGTPPPHRVLAVKAVPFVGVSASAAGTGARSPPPMAHILTSKHESRWQVKNEVEAPPTPFHFSGANGGEEVASSPPFALLKWKEVAVRASGLASALRGIPACRRPGTRDGATDKRTELQRPAPPIAIGPRRQWPARSDRRRCRAPYARRLTVRPKLPAPRNQPSLRIEDYVAASQRGARSGSEVLGMRGDRRQRRTQMRTPRIPGQKRDTAALPALGWDSSGWDNKYRPDL
ncbi:hypothetical protein HPB47_024046, partial [Ixodes persulcatus]